MSMQRLQFIKIVNISAYKIILMCTDIRIGKNFCADLILYFLLISYMDSKILHNTL